MTDKPIIVAGIDVGKAWLDAHILEGELDRRFPNTKAGHRALLAWLAVGGVTRAVFEPTGRYHRLLHRRLFEAGLETVLVNPLRSRRFAEAVGRLAKNDRVDAAMLARCGLLAGAESVAPRPESLEQLSDILGFRRKIVEHMDAMRKAAGEFGSLAAGCSGAILKSQKEAVARCDRLMQECIQADPALARRAAIVRSVPGIGPVNAASLLADMPELGQLGRRKAASLLGLAPFDRDSGKRRGRRCIQGGRARPRHLLYMAALSAIRCEPASRDFYRRLVADGKEHKLAMVAVMRKLAGLLDALLRDNRLWQTEPPARPSEAAA